MKIFGVKISLESKNEILKKINRILSQKKISPFFIATLNPEILLLARENQDYKNILNQANLRIVDGFGIVLLSKIKGKKVGERMVGADLAEIILSKALFLGLKIGLVMKKGGLSGKKELEEKLEIGNWKPACHQARLKIGKNKINKKFNNTKNNYEILELDEYILNQKKDIKKVSEKLENIQVLLVGLGAPHQEKFIFKIKKYLPNLRLAIGVGGSFDFWTGQQKRAPKIFRIIGLEWLWRFVLNPRRILRIWRATAVFIFRGLTGR